MEQNYYSILKIPTNSTYIDICQAYKTLSLKHHPQNNEQEEEKSSQLSIIQNYKTFSNLAEAFIVLSDKKTKDIYDKHGYKTLINGLKSPPDESFPGFQFLGNSKEIFETFFGTNNFFAALVQDENEYNEFIKRKSKIKIDEPIDIILEKELTLLDIYYGTTFEVEFEKLILEADLTKSKKTKFKK